MLELSLCLENPLVNFVFLLASFCEPLDLLLALHELLCQEVVHILWFGSSNLLLLDSLHDKGLEVLLLFGR